MSARTNDLRVKGLEEGIEIYIVRKGGRGDGRDSRGGGRVGRDAGCIKVDVVRKGGRGDRDAGCIETDIVRKIGRVDSHISKVDRAIDNRDAGCMERY